LGLGLELSQGLESAMDGATGCVEAVLESGEGARVGGEGMAEGVLFGVAVNVVVLVFPGLGFGGAQASEGPLAGDEIVEQEAGLGGGGLMVLVILFDELLEVGELFGFEYERFGVDAGFEGVHGGDGLACDRGGAGGFLGVAAIRFYLSERGHGEFRRDRGPRGCPGLSYFEDKAPITGIRGRFAVNGWIQEAKILDV